MPTGATLLERDDIDAVCDRGARPSCTPRSPWPRSTRASTSSSRSRSPPRLEDGTAHGGRRARAPGVKLMVGHVERFNPAVGKMAELIAEGRLGRVFRAHATRVGPLPARIRDAGVAIDLATHDLDVMQFVLGRDITRVYAEGTRFAHPTQEDMLSCLLRFGDDGPFGLLDVNWLTPEKRRELDVIGEDGMLQRLLPHAGRLVHGVAEERRPAGTSSPACAATPRARPCASRCARSSRCGRARGLRRVRPRRHAGAGHRLRRLPRADRRARGPRLGRQLAPRDAARHARPPAPASRSPPDPPSRSLAMIRFVIPAYNEAENIARLLADLAPRARELGARVIFVDDGSTDGTAEAIEAHRAGPAPRGRPPPGQPRPRAPRINTGLRAALGEAARRRRDRHDRGRQHLRPRRPAAHARALRRGLRPRARLGLRAGRQDHRRRAAGAWRLQGRLGHASATSAGCRTSTRCRRSTASTAPARCAAPPRPTATCSCASPASRPTSSCCSSSTTPARRSPRCRRSTTGAGARASRR